MYERKLIFGAMLASLLVHLGVVLLTWDLPLFRVEDAEAVTSSEEEYIELFVMPAEGAEETSPSTFVDVPESRAAEAPEKPQFLALHDSRAADLLAGGSDDNSPASEREEDFYQVAIKRDAPGGQRGMPAAVLPPVMVSEPEPTETEAEGEDEPQDESVENPVEEHLGAEGEVALATGREASGRRPPQDDLEYFQPEPPSILKQGSGNDSDGSPGDRGFEFDEAAISKAGGNVRVDNDFSLSTTAWDYAPWMSRFSQNLRRNIVVPPAWYLGVVDGHTVVDIVVERDGTASYLEVVEKEGHESLHLASLAAFSAFQPFDQLPSDFPDENLVIRYTLIYPPIQKLRDEAERARNASRQGLKPSRR